MSSTICGFAAPDQTQNLSSSWTLCDVSMAHHRISVKVVEFRSPLLTLAPASSKMLVTSSRCAVPVIKLCGWNHRWAQRLCATASFRIDFQRRTVIRVGTSLLGPERQFRNLPALTVLLLGGESSDCAKTLNSLTNDEARPTNE
jgi:hypothetical protein